jgi:two-component system, OmpR family, sensor histidine kinase MprB
VKLRTRLALAAAFATAFAVAAFSIVALISADNEINDEIDEQLQDQARVGVGVVEEVRDGSAVLSRVDENGVDYRIHGTATRLFAANGDVVTEGPYPDVRVTAVDRTVVRTQGDPITRTETRRGSTYRIVTYPAGELLGVEVGIQVVRPIDDIEQSLDQLTLIFIVLGVAAALVAMVIGWLLARTVTRPVTRLAGITAHIAETEDLAIEVPERGGAEIKDLARSFNQMLATLRASRLQQSQLVADAGHELRTPITSLRTNIEVLAEGRGLKVDEYHDLLGDAQAQLEELSDLVANLTELSRADESVREEYVDVRLDELTRSAVSRVRTRAPADTRFEVLTQPRVVVGQPSLLERAIINVLDNAVKWNRPGGTITVELDQRALTITDDGAGIATEDRAHVFERFWRAPDARSQPGSGLGLAIVSRIVTSHGGRVAIEEAPGRGARIAITLPATEPGAAAVSEDLAERTLKAF